MGGILNIQDDASLGLVREKEGTHLGSSVCAPTKFTGCGENSEDRKDFILLAMKKGPYNEKQKNGHIKKHFWPQKDPSNVFYLLHACLAFPPKGGAGYCHSP